MIRPAVVSSRNITGRVGSGQEVFKPSRVGSGHPFTRPILDLTREVQPDSWTAWIIKVLLYGLGGGHLYNARETDHKKTHQIIRKHPKHLPGTKVAD